MDFLEQLIQRFRGPRTSPSELYRQQHPGIREKMEMQEWNPYNNASPMDLRMLQQLPPEMLRKLEQQYMDHGLNNYQFQNIMRMLQKGRIQM